MKYVGRILVEDASGSRLEVHEYKEERIFRSMRRFRLDSGERVERVTAKSFVVVATGEMLVVVDQR